MRWADGLVIWQDRIGWMGTSSPSSLTGCAIIDGGMVIRWRSVDSGDVYLYSFTDISESTIIAENQNINIETSTIMGTKIL